MRARMKNFKINKSIMIVFKMVKVAILGACGVLGQRFVQMLTDHPSFNVSALVDIHKGKKYGEVTDWGHGGGFDEEIPEYARGFC